MRLPLCGAASLAILAFLSACGGDGVPGDDGGLDGGGDDGGGDGGGLDGGGLDGGGDGGGGDGGGGDGGGGDGGGGDGGWDEDDCRAYPATVTPGPDPSVAWLTTWSATLAAGNLVRVELPARDAGEFVLELQTATQVQTSSDRVWLLDEAGVRAFDPADWSVPIVQWPWAEGQAASAMVACGGAWWALPNMMADSIRAYAPDTGEVLRTLDLSAWGGEAGVVEVSSGVGMGDQLLLGVGNRVLAIDCVSGELGASWDLGEEVTVRPDPAREDTVLVFSTRAAWILDLARGRLTQPCWGLPRSEVHFSGFGRDARGNAWIAERKYNALRGEEPGFLRVLCFDAHWDETGDQSVVMGIGANVSRMLGGDGQAFTWARRSDDVLPIRTLNCRADAPLAIAQAQSLAFQ